VKARTKYPGSLLSLALFMLLSAFFFGCASPTHQSLTAQERSMPAAPERIKTSTTETRDRRDFLVIKSASVISGKVSTDDRRIPLGSISFGPDNEVRWKGNKLSFVEKNRGAYRFYDHVSRNHLRMATEVDRDDRNTAVLVEANGSIGKIIFIGHTENGTGKFFADRLTGISFPENFIGLVAESKYVDGNAVPLSGFEYCGSLRLVEHGCLLNERPAAISTFTFKDGAKSLVVANGEHELVVSPNGSWFSQRISDRGISFVGSDSTLERFYLRLRENIKEPVSTKPEHSSPTSPSTGTGFFITDDGFLITNEHVVKEAAQVRLVTSAGIISAKVVKVDGANDLALLKASNKQFTLSAEEFLEAPNGFTPKQVDLKFAALPVVASRAMRLGSTVATVGFPNVGLQGFAPKLARGEIAALSGVQDDARHFQISVPVQPGNSGGALVDERGNVVGVVSAKLSARAALAASGALPENVNYAVKSSFLLSFLESVPEVSAKVLADGHRNANAKERKFEDVVKAAEQAAVLVLVY
jgi:S1-C subfamily serine protease